MSTTVQLLCKIFQICNSKFLHDILEYLHYNCTIVLTLVTCLLDVVDFWRERQVTQLLGPFTIRPLAENEIRLSSEQIFYSSSGSHSSQLLIWSIKFWYHSWKIRWLFASSAHNAMWEEKLDIFRSFEKVLLTLTNCKLIH